MNIELVSYLIQTTKLSKLRFKTQKSGCYVAIVLTLSAMTATVLSSWHPVIAQENSRFSTNGFKVTFNPPTADKPKRTTGGASRTIGECISRAEKSAIPFTPLLPDSTSGLTTAAYPMILAYLPETSANKVFFSWQDEDGNEHYQTILPMEQESGIISLTLPETAPPLQVGKNYQWALALMCDGKLQPDSPIVRGEIRRVQMASSLSDRLQTADNLETAAIYGEAGIWYETASTMAQLVEKRPDDAFLVANWQDLLTSVGLEQVALVSSDELYVE